MNDSSAEIILQLALPSPLRRSFDYLPPEGGAPPHGWRPGQRLQVPFGSRQLVGILLGVSDHSDYRDKLRPATAWLDAEPLLPVHLLELARWAASYYQHPLGDALFNWLPALLRKGKPAQLCPQTYWRCVDPSADALAQIPVRAQRQRQLWQQLSEQPEGLSASQLKDEGFTATVIKRLADKAFIELLQYEPQQAEGLKWADQPLLREAPLTLNAEQQQALQSLRPSLDRFQPFLLEGVTGSGKTEVYLQLITQVLEQGRQALVLVPEIGLTPQMVSRFRKRFRVPVAVMHSGLNDRERLDAWLHTQRGQAAILIGTRSAVMTPLARPGVLIIDEEHDASFKQQEGFRYSARDIAIMRARAEKIPIVLGSATPSLETLLNARRGRYEWLRLGQRAGGAEAPRIELLDIRQQPLTDGLSERALHAMRECLERQEQVLVFLNRRGFAPVLMCHDCGWQADCQYCDAHMTLHRQPVHLHCHHCNHQQPLPPRCLHCQSYNLKPVGAGTERTEQSLQQHFSQVPVLRVDRDSTRRKGALQQLLDKVESAGPCILLGTQMLAKGHHFPRVTLVVIVDADGGLFSADFRGMEKMVQLLLQVAGRAGRADRPGRVLMQTLNADHPRIQSLVQEGYDAFVAQELEVREQGRMPPFRFYVLLRAEDPNLGRAEAFLHLAKRLMAPLNDGSVELLGPLPSPMEKRAGRYRAQLLLQADQRRAVQQLCQRWIQQLDKDPAASRLAQKVRWSLDVDPLEMF